MILTPIAPGQLRRALAGFAAALDNEEARRVFRRIARPRDARRARGAAAARHHAAALRLAHCFGMGLRPGSPGASVGWDGRAARTATEAYVLLHEVAHFQLASPRRRRAIDFGLGPGPETGNRRAADHAALLFGLAREREEAMASLLGILWERALGQPGLASFLDQNWLEGASARAARHFATILAALRAAGFAGATGRPTRRLQQRPDVTD
ncbi:MAG TPA: hypothetical protein VN832_03155 [Stellaceae bacterium]|nr:hypothetical protein [Stellaceae bacterium]